MTRLHGFMLLAIALSGGAFAQTAPDWTLSFVANDKLGKSFRQFEVPRGDGTKMTAFLVLPRGETAPARKPLMIFVDGSGAQSQFTSLPDGRTAVGLFGAIGQQAAAKFHVACVEKRGVKFGESASMGGADGAPEEYQLHATWEGRVAEVRRLVDALAAQPCVDGSRIVLMGHSEGADVAAGVAAADPRVTHVAFLAGGGPTQLFDLHLLLRKRMQRESKSAEEIEAAIGSQEKQFRAILAKPESTKDYFMGHAYRRWASFANRPPIESLLKTRAKLFVAHGSEDTSVPIESFDLLALELMRAGRTDVAVHRLPGCGHGLSPAADGPGAAPLGSILPALLEWAGS